MTARPHRLHVISRSPSSPAVGPSSGDLALLLGILVFSLLPVGGVLLGGGLLARGGGRGRGGRDPLRPGGARDGPRAPPREALDAPRPGCLIRPGGDLEDRKPGLAGYLRAAAIIAVTSAVAAGARSALGVPDVEMLYLLGVMATALTGGRRRLPPRRGPRGRLVRLLLRAAPVHARRRRRAVPPHLRDDVRGERRDLDAHAAAARRALGRALAGAERVRAPRARPRPGGALDERAVGGRLRALRGGGPRRRGRVPARARRGGARHARVARRRPRSHPGRTRSRAGRSTTAAPPGSEPRCTPRSRSCASRCGLGRRRRGPRGAPRRRARPSTDEQRALLEAIARQAALALDRIRLSEDARAAALRADASEMRSGLLSAVSHDFRTPLAAITGAATTLRDEAAIDPALRRELVETVCDEADRLERIVSNLLDMTRLDSGAVEPKREWIPVGRDGRGRARPARARRSPAARSRPRSTRTLPLALGRPVLDRAAAPEPPRERGQVHAAGVRARPPRRPGGGPDRDGGLGRRAGDLPPATRSASSSGSSAAPTPGVRGVGLGPRRRACHRAGARRRPLASNRPGGGALLPAPPPARRPSAPSPRSTPQGSAAP